MPTRPALPHSRPEPGAQSSPPPEAPGSTGCRKSSSGGRRRRNRSSTSRGSRRSQEHVRRGNALLITLGRTPGSAAFRFTPLSPSSAWQSLMQLGHRGQCGTRHRNRRIRPRVFPESSRCSAPGYRWRLRPVHAAERGETRLECLERDIPYLKLPRKPGEAFHSRPLLNRNWKTRLRADDPAGESLLITGQYGAGRVALFASELNSGTPEFWADVLRYLAGAEPAGAEAPRSPESNSSSTATSARS